MDLTEYQVNITLDNRSGRATAFLLRLMESGQWTWVHDHDFGPFDTTLDICAWLTRAMARDLEHHSGYNR